MIKTEENLGIGNHFHVKLVEKVEKILFSIWN